MSPSRRDQLRLQVEELEAQRLGNSLVRLGRLTYQRTVERLRARGLSGSGSATPRCCHTSTASRVSSDQLAERMGVTKQAAGQMVTQLEQAQLVTRRPDPKDGRAQRVELTTQGFEVLLAGLEVFAELEAELEEALGSERMDVFRSSADQSRRYLESLDDERSSRTSKEERYDV